MLVCAFFCALCARDRGCSAHPTFPAPSFEGQLRKTRTHSAPREDEIVFSCRRPGPPVLGWTRATWNRRKTRRWHDPAFGIRRMDMVPDGVSSRGDLWVSIRREAEAALARDPIFGRSLSTSILDHPHLGAAVSHQIGQRLGKSTRDRHQFERIANEAFAASLDLVDAASRDLDGIVLHDPASTGLLPALLNFKGYVALQTCPV